MPTWKTELVELRDKWKDRMPISIGDVAKSLSMKSVDEDDVVRDGEEEHDIEEKDDVDVIGGVEHQDGLIDSVAI